MKKIEKPGFEGVVYYNPTKDNPRYFDKWFDENIEPINQILENAVEVRTSCPEDGVIYDCDWWQGYSREIATHKALLINIEPIKKG